MQSFEAIYARMLFAAQVRTQSELAAVLGIRQASISDAKKRKSIPSDWCMRLYDSRGVKVDWQRFGVGPVYDEEKIRQIERMNSGDWASDPLPAGGFLHEGDTPPLIKPVPGEMPYYSTYVVGEGTFPEIGHQVFPVEFLRPDVQIFRLLETCMAPALNRGALIAVEKKADAQDGDIVAVILGRELVFRRLSIVAQGYELRTERRQAEDTPHLVEKKDWPALYYGKALWAFQPL